MNIYPKGTPAHDYYDCLDTISRHHNTGEANRRLMELMNLMSVKTQHEILCSFVYEAHQRIRSQVWDEAREHERNVIVNRLQNDLAEYLKDSV